MVNIMRKITGNKEKYSLEERFLNVSTFVGCSICFIAALTNYILGLGLLVIALPLLMAILSVFLYIKAIRREHYKAVVYTILIACTFGLYPATYIYNGGSFGGIPMLFIFNALISAILLDKFKNKIFILIHYIVAMVLFIIEFIKSDIIVGYDSELIRLLDVGVTLFLVSISTYLILFSIMKNYKNTIEELEITKSELITLNDELKIRTITDMMTGIHNRRYIMEKLSEEISIRRNNEELSVIMYDIDFFKSINDTYGHNIGDEVIVKICQFLKNRMRKSDYVGRIGGEEFLIVLPNTSLEIAYVLADKLREQISERKWSEEALNITISGGVYAYKQNDSLNAMIVKADQYLYKAKEDGRNNVKRG